MKKKEDNENGNAMNISNTISNPNVIKNKNNIESINKELGSVKNIDDDKFSKIWNFEQKFHSTAEKRSFSNGRSNEIKKELFSLMENNINKKYDFLY